MKNAKTLVVLNTLGLILMLVLNSLAVAMPLNGQTTKELSDMYPNLFVPAGVTFSIWSIIYLLLIVQIVYQWIALSNPQYDSDFINQMGIWFFISSLANSFWILAWHFLLPGLSLVIMLVLLFSLIKIYLALRIGAGGGSKLEKYLVHICFSIYLGWISVATIANATAVLVGYGWNGGGMDPANWAIIMISIAILLGMFFLWQKADFPYALVIGWALFGIYLKRSGADILEPGIVWATQIGMVILFVVMIFVLVKRRFVKPV